MKHIVKLTLSNPSHEYVSMRARTKQQDYISEGRDEAEAINRATRHFRTLGFKVHSAVIVEQKVELPEPVKAEPVTLSEAVDYKALEKPTIARIKSGETKLPPRTDYDKPAYLRKKAVDKKAALEAYIARRKETSVVTEETAPQYIEEKLTAADPASKWIHDFVKSDNPKFAGKSKEERIKMALGAKYGAMKNEEVAPEEVDEETKQRKAAVAKDKVGRLAWRAQTGDEVKKNHLKLYKKLKSTDPEKAEKFKQANKIEEESVDEASADYKKAFSTVATKNLIKDTGTIQRKLRRLGGSAQKNYIGMQPKVDMTQKVTAAVTKKGTYSEEVEQIDEAGYIPPPVPKEVTKKHLDDAHQMTKKWKKGMGASHELNNARATEHYKKLKDAATKAVRNAHAKGLLNNEEVEQTNEAADPGATKVVNKQIKTKKAAVAADRLVKIAKSKVNKINLDPKIDHDVKQSNKV